MAPVPGASVSYRVVLTLPSDLHIPGPVLRGAIAITRVNPEGTFPLDPGSPDAIGGSDDAALQPGCIPSI
ncbi:MAG: hypothetical protein JOZ63_09425 [Planctomycetaceae bacterium]|nr:hypothetical protein [Planctomycetaceae bacterium]